MKSNNLYNKDQKKPNNLFQQNMKLIKKGSSEKFISNNRYQNYQSQDNNYFNNHFIYESYNKKGYNGIKDPSLSGNNNYLIVKNPLNASQNLRYPSKTKENVKIEVNRLYHKNINKSEKKTYYDSKNFTRSERSKISNKIIPKNDFLKWNNIGYKEVKYKNKFEIPTYDIYSKDTLIKSCQQLPPNSYNGPIAQNLGFYNSNSNYSQKNINKNYNINHSLNYKQKTTPTYNIDKNKNKRSNNLYHSNLYSSNNNNNKNINNVLLWSKQRNINNLKKPEHLRSIEMDDDNNKKKDIINDEILFKKSNNNINNTSNNITNNIITNNLSISYNRNLNNDYNKKYMIKNYNYEFDDQNQYSNNNFKEKLKEKENKQQKYKTPNNYYKNTISIYQFYRDIKKRPKPDKNLEKNYYKSSGNINNKNNINDINHSVNNKNDKYLKNVCKIQSIWRGGYVRELMSYYWSLSKFKDLLDSILLNHAKQNFFNNIKLLNKNEKNISPEIKIENINNFDILINDNNDNDNDYNNKKDFEELKINLSKKEKDYDNLLKDYNYIKNQFSELKKKNDEYNNINKINIDNKKDEMTKNYNIDNNNFEIINEYKKIKKFDNMLQEQKEELNFISDANTNTNTNANKNTRLRGQKPKKRTENTFNEDLINTIKIDYNDYLNHFKSNLNIINNDQINIEKNPTIKEKENEKEKEKEIEKDNKENKVEYKVTNYNLSLINNNINKNPTIKEICHNEQISIVDNYSKSQTLIENDSIYKSNNNDNNDLTSVTTIKDNKSNLVPENQINLNTEIKGNNDINTISFKDMKIEEQNNINLINNLKQNEFDIKFLTVKNDISLGIINETHPKNENEKTNLNDNVEERTNNENVDNKDISDLEKKTESVNKNKDLIIETNENISLLHEKKKIEYKEKLLISDNENIHIKGNNKQKCDKMTEISEEINKIEPNNNSEKTINNNEIVENKINIINEDSKEGDNTNNNKVILEVKQELEFINNKKPKLTNYNEINEIEKGDGLEINPYEMKRTQNNINNIFISYENNMQMPNNKNNIFNEKAKKNMMKIILPVKIKTILKDWVKKNIFKLLINKLRKISFITHLIIINNNYRNKSKKLAFEKVKDNYKMIKFKNYFLNEIGKNRIKHLLKKYAVYKWNILLSDLAKLIISNKSLVVKKQ